MEPNFIVIGAPKAATTGLCLNLKRHPDIFISNPKEPFFFCYDHKYAKGWEWYMSLFEGAEGKTAIGEGSTPYSQIGTYPNTVGRIAKHLPNVKLIYSVREPLERIQSQWIEQQSQGLTMLPFLRAVREDPQYIDAASYWTQINAYRQHFPDERILVLFFEEYRKDPQGVLRQCFEFLGVDPNVKIEGAEKPVYASKGKRSDIWLTNMMRRNVPGFLAIRDRVPKNVRSLASQLFKREIKERPTWDQATRSWVLDQIRDDVIQFLRFYGKSDDYWTLE